MRTIDDFFVDTAPHTLYHYTSISALLGMANGRKVWASHVYYLNDSREILHACTVLKEVLSQRHELAHLRLGAYMGEERIFIGEFREWLDTFVNTPHHLFVFSLSEEKSLLSQWRSYTPHGKGVSLGFSPETLNEMLRTSGGRIAKCVYLQREHVDFAWDLIDKMLDTFRKRLPSIDTTARHPSQKYHEFLDEFRAPMLQALAIIKDPAFKEEQEWRIVSPYFPRYTVAEIKFREGASLLKPYIEIDLPAGILFDQVLLGPTEHNNLSHAALSTFLSNKQLSKDTVSSMIPYREWGV
jgi:hypothetical protein